MPVIPATQEAEAGESFEHGREEKGKGGEGNVTKKNQMKIILFSNIQLLKYLKFTGWT